MGGNKYGEELLLYYEEKKSVVRELERQILDRKCNYIIACLYSVEWNTVYPLITLKLYYEYIVVFCIVVGYNDNQTETKHR